MNVQNYINKLEERYQNPYIQIPNKLISQITNALRNNNYEAYSHYAFSYLVVNGFLYKYSHYMDLEDGEYINTSNIKELLKYNPRSQKIDKVSKRKGILEEEGFCETTTDIPVSVYWEDINSKGMDKRKVILLSEAGEDTGRIVYNNLLRTPNFHICIPCFMIDYRTKEGSLNKYDNTFRLTLKELKHFLYDESFTLRDFFVYCYIKSSKRKDGISSLTYDTFKRQTGLSKATVSKTLIKLESKNIIAIKNNGNSYHLKKNSNTYKVKSSFLKDMSYNKKRQKPTTMAF